MRFSKTVIFLFFLCLTTVIQAQYQTDSAKVSLITASPGDETYTIFGHSALRVEDKMQGYDYVFNWGTFDFNTENFYLKFSTGKLLYFLSISNFPDFINQYYQNGQAIYLQKLNLTNKEKYVLLNNIQINYQEENKYFRYDFARDNCATRIRDIVAKSIDGKVVYDSTYAGGERESIRRLFGAHLENTPWTYFGLNLIMGKSTDSIASLHDYMYLPVHLKNLFASAIVISNEGTKKLTEAPVELFPTKIVSLKPSFISTPFAVCFLLFLAVLIFSIWEFRKNRYNKSIDIFLFMVTGLLGLLITWLWGWSLHIYVHNNLHIVWASPLNFFVALALIFKPAKGWLKYYFAIYAASILLLIPVSFFVIQEFAGAVYFLMGVMLVRAVRIYLNKIPNHL